MPEFYIAYDNEGFESAKAATMIPAASLKAALDYAVTDLLLGHVDSFQIYSSEGALVYDSKKGVAA